MNFYRTWRLSENKSIDIQLCTDEGFSDWFGIKIFTLSKCDHGGFRFEFELLRVLYFHLWITDNRHWDYDNDQWETYES